MTIRRKPGPRCCHRCGANREHTTPEMCIEFLAGVLEENKRLLKLNRKMQAVIEDFTWMKKRLPNDITRQSTSS